MEDVLHVFILKEELSFFLALPQLAVVFLRLLYK
jgi:hypothetical protein